MRVLVTKACPGHTRQLRTCTTPYNRTAAVSAAAGVHVVAISISIADVQTVLMVSTTVVSNATQTRQRAIAAPLVFERVGFCLFAARARGPKLVEPRCVVVVIVAYRGIFVTRTVSLIMMMMVLMLPVMLMIIVTMALMMTIFALETALNLSLTLMFESTTPFPSARIRIYRQAARAAILVMVQRY